MAEKIKDELMEHDFDGIQELDNVLPPWWLYLFYFTIAWAIVYMFHYHILGTGDLQIAEYENEIKQAQVLYQKSSQSMGETEMAMEAYTDADNLAKGKEVFMTNCFVCHGELGEGGIGPNLTDKFWIHGGTMAEIVQTINVGVPPKGMISWRPVLSQEAIRQVSSYILSLQGTNPPDAKEPEGELVESN